MNCKPGDLAVILHPSMAGKLVLVVEPAPVGSFRYPDGVKARGDYVGCWVIECLSGDFSGVLCGDGLPPVSKRFGHCHDRWLRPIRDNDGEDEMLRITGKPQETVRDILKELAQQ